MTRQLHLSQHYLKSPKSPPHAWIKGFNMSRCPAPQLRRTCRMRCMLMFCVCSYLAPFMADGGRNLRTNAALQRQGAVRVSQISGHGQADHGQADLQIRRHIPSC
jgi:hypothetical protein